MVNSFMRALKCVLVPNTMVELAVRWTLLQMLVVQGNMFHTQDLTCKKYQGLSM